MPAFDVIVVGLGTAGSATCLALARQGVSVLGLDAFAPPHPHGSHHGSSRSIRRAYLEGTAYVPMALRAWDQWRRIERDTGTALLTTTGNLTIGPESGPAVTGFLASAQAYGIPHEALTAAEVRRRWPRLAVPDGLAAGLEKEAGILQAERCIATLMSQATKAGAVLHVNERVRQWQVQNKHVLVHTCHSTYTAGRLLLAAGARNKTLLGASGDVLAPKRVAVHWIDPPPGGDFHHGALPVNFWQLSWPDSTAPKAYREFYCLPVTTHGTGVKVAAHNNLSDCDPERLRPSATAAEKAAVEAFLEAYLPSLAGRPAKIEMCLYTQTPDGDFWMGPLPEQPDVFACALAGHGFKFAPVLGEILAEMLTGGSPAFDIGCFAASRFDRSYGSDGVDSKD
jgi:sarcosine oxidase